MYACTVDSAYNTDGYSGHLRLVPTTLYKQYASVNVISTTNRVK